MKRILFLFLALVLSTTQVFAAAGNYTNVQQALTTSAKVDVKLGNLYGFSVYNPNGAATWVMYYNSTTAPTIGSTTNLMYEIAVPAGTTIVHPITDGGAVFSSGLYVAVATTATGSTAPATGLTITTVYR